MPFLSVIIPVYKVEPYLRQCVDSVLNQNLDDTEIILIDDGSPDGCPAICDEYAAQFDGVRVIHQENGGSSAARNTGIRNAAGEYIIFLDSDDWWNPDVDVKNMLIAAKTNPKVDVFLFSGLDYVDGEGYFERTDSVRKLEGECYNAEEYYKTMLALGNLQVHAATKILKTAFLREHNLEFPNGIKGEDNEWMIRVLRCNPLIMILSDLLYIYRSGRTDSITNTIDQKNIVDLLQIVDKSLRYYELADVDHYVMEQEYAFCAYLWFCALGLSSRLNKLYKRNIKPWLQKTQEVCKYSIYPKTKLAYALYRTIGNDMTMLILGTYIKLKSFYHLSRNKVK